MDRTLLNLVSIGRESDPSVIEKLEVNFRRDERVIRFLTIKQEKYAAEYAARRRSLRQTKSEEA